MIEPNYILNPLSVNFEALESPHYFRVNIIRPKSNRCILCRQTASGGIHLMAQLAIIKRNV